MPPIPDKSARLRVSLCPKGRDGGGCGTVVEDLDEINSTHCGHPTIRLALVGIFMVDQLHALLLLLLQSWILNS